jgi:hypothetical protein
MATKQFLVEFKIGGYRDDILCDVIPMDVCHVLSGRPWEYDKNFIHDGRKILIIWRRMVGHTCYYQ